MAWSGVPVEHLLCAHVCDQTWLCHRRSFTGDALSTNQFGENDLAPIDLSTDLWCDGQERPRKRIRAHLPIGHLADLASKHDRAFNALVARAHFEAEVTRASTLHAAVDESRALAGYDPNPFNWTGGTRLDICYLWSIRTPGGCERQLSFIRLSELLSSGRRVPFPQRASTVSDENRQGKLELMAQNELTLRRTHCVYLGVEVRPGQFEKDQRKWQLNFNRSKAEVAFEWPNVIDRDGTTHRSSVRADRTGRSVPCNPLFAGSSSGITFTVDFAEALGKAVHEAIDSQGVAFEGDAPKLLKQMPNGGVDCQDIPVYWTLPDGRCVSYSLREMANLRDDDIAPQDSHDAYLAVAKELGYDALGKPENDEAFEEYRLDPGTVTERRWENLNWQRPADETSPCWWLANAAAAKAADEEDQEAPVKLVCRSLQVLRLELRATRCATSLKLRQEWERRLENNGRSVDVLESNGQLWKHVGGPSPHLLRRPTEADVVVAHSAVNNLQRLLHSGARGGGHSRRWACGICRRDLHRGSQNQSGFVGGHTPRALPPDTTRDLWRALPQCPGPHRETGRGRLQEACATCCRGRRQGRRPHTGGT